MTHDTWHMTHDIFTIESPCPCVICVCLRDIAENPLPGDFWAKSMTHAHDTWHMTQDTWYMTHDTWHMTHETWHMTHDTWHMTQLPAGQDSFLVGLGGAWGGGSGFPWGAGGYSDGTLLTWLEELWYTDDMVWRGLLHYWHGWRSSVTLLHNYSVYCYF